MTICAIYGLLAPIYIGHTAFIFHRTVLPKEGPISELQSIASWHSAGASSCRSVVAVHHVQQERLLRLSYQVTAHRGLW